MDCVCGMTLECNGERICSADVPPSQRPGAEPIAEMASEGIVSYRCLHRHHLHSSSVYARLFTLFLVVAVFTQNAAAQALVTSIGSDYAAITETATGNTTSIKQSQSPKNSSSFTEKVQPGVREQAVHSDNDVHYPISSSGVRSSNSSYVEEREEKDNRIADPQLVNNSSVALSKTSSSLNISASEKSTVELNSASHDPRIKPQNPISKSPTRTGVQDAADIADATSSPSPQPSIVTARVEFPSEAVVADTSAVTLNESSDSNINLTSILQESMGRSMDGNTSSAINSAQNVNSAKNTNKDLSLSKSSLNTTNSATKTNFSRPTESITTERSNKEELTTHFISNFSEYPDEMVTEQQTSMLPNGSKKTPFDEEQPLDGTSSRNTTVSSDTHECARECIAGEAPKRCYYLFEVSGYYAMSKACYDCPHSPEDCDLPDCVAADGVPRGLVVVNRMLPGPAIEVCMGDTVIVDLHNGMVSETTSVHWHGHHQRGTPYMDGVPHVTQCPVPPMTTFRYNFLADTPGTHFWHSHTGHQRADGAFGSLVVRPPRSADATAALWDRDEREHTLLLLDWGSAGGVERFLAHHHSRGPNKPTALLVNGRGRVPPSPPSPDAPEEPVPAPEFIVQQGLRYRFRLINAGFLNCPVEISVDDHDLLIIASDGGDVRPVAATSLVSYAGERFDFVIEANRSVSAYWIRMRGLLDCDERFNAVHQAAILRYQGAPDGEPLGELSYFNAHRPGHQVNSFNVGEGTPGSTVIPELDAMVPDDESLKEEPDYRFYLAYDFYALDNPHFHKAPYYGFYNVTDVNQRTFTPQFNHLSMKMPSVPMLPQREELDQNLFCNASSMAGKGCEGQYCECAHVIQVPLNSVLELVLIDEGVPYDANHPFHLHGYAFRVVAMQRLGNSTSLEEVRRLDEQGLIHRKLHSAPLKDTCTVPDGGFTILRVRASNPGYWLFHCHIEFHVEIGMALVFKIGDHAEFPPVPKGFPRCGNWIPDDDVETIAIPSNDENNKENLSQQRNSRLQHRSSSATILSNTSAILMLFSLLVCVHS